MLSLEPEYAQSIIVGIIMRKTFAWYITEKEYWYLDITKYERALLKAGYNKSDPSLGDYSDRFDIPILNEVTADLFLKNIENCRVTSYKLSQMFLKKVDSLEKGDALLDFAPCFLVDFDQRKFNSMYPEMIRFEFYVPDGWNGVRRDFLSEIPTGERYWIINGRNLFT
jgi:hypothetical protein